MPSVPGVPAMQSRRSLALRTIFTAGLVAGTLDLALAIIFFAVQGAPLLTIPHAIAAGLLGVRAFHGGISIAILGVALHYFIALTVADVYYAASLRIKSLNRHALFSGAAYGIAVFLVMSFIVVPLSAAPRSRPSPAWLIADIGSHIFFIGITIALITRRFAASHASPENTV
ncbi:MAG: hypothetical protein WA634_06045 [Silvibacterium sp.]